MARYRGRHITIHAVRNDGAWSTILAFLEEIDMTRVPMFGYPPVTRGRDGALTIWDSKQAVPVGDWLYMTPMRLLYGFTDSDFTSVFEPIKEDEK